MQKRFEIIGEEFHRNNNIMLLVDAGKSHLNVLAIDHVNKRALAACNFEMNDMSYESLADLSSRHEIFKPSCNKMAVAYNFPESVLTPAEYNRDDNSS
ncbi:MAG: hypothetical protein ABUT20_65720, partial [Bacteroidota bacterium]